MWSASSPTAAPIIRLAGAVLMEQNDEWTEAWRHMGLQVLTKADALTPSPPAAGIPGEANAIEPISA